MTFYRAETGFHFSFPTLTPIFFRCPVIFLISTSSLHRHGNTLQQTWTSDFDQVLDTGLPFASLKPPSSALGQTLAPIYLWANADGHLPVGQLLVTFFACLPQCLWYECLCQTACAQNACVNLLVASQKGKFACCQIACWTIACIQQLLVWWI